MFKRIKESFFKSKQPEQEIIEIEIINNSNTNTINYYKQERDRYLKSKLPGYPMIEELNIRISFSISSSAKNGQLVYAILDKMPNNTYTIERNSVSLFLDQNQLSLNAQTVADILSVIRQWKSAHIYCNEAEFDYSGFFRLLDYLQETESTCAAQKKTTQELYKKYLSKTRCHRQDSTPKAPSILLSRHNPQQALEDVIQTYVNNYGKNKEVQLYSISEIEKVVVIENDLIVYFWLMAKYWAQSDNEYDHKDWEYPFIAIQELTHNDLTKFNFSGFKRYFSYDYVGILFLAFHGLNYYEAELDKFDYVNSKLPALNLYQRFEQYPGELHHFIILKIENADGEIYYGIGETKQKVHSFIIKLCSELEKKNSRSLELNGASCLPFSENRDFVTAFLSWKGKSKRWRLENIFSYSYIDRNIKNDSELFYLPAEIVSEAYDGKYQYLEFGSYTKPVNRWKSEELVYNITKKLYKDYQVLYQYRPYFLATDSGNMSYDIYICGLKIAIEYQGKQHFEPVEYFGGKDNFEAQQRRDHLKAEKSKENGIKLIYINYWEDITPDLIRQRIETAMQNNTL